MAAQYHTIKERSRPFEMAPISAADFDLDPGPESDAHIVLNDPSLSLYCLDYENRRALFVELPAEHDIGAVPFIYAVQAEHATRVLTVPFVEAEALADDVSVRDDQIGLIYSTGRCGSTLVSAAFREAEGVVSLSEPDFYTGLIALGAAGQLHNDELQRYLRMGTRLLCKATPQVPDPRFWIIKFRSQVMTVVEQLTDIFPDAHRLYLYRNADTWLRSVTRMIAGSEVDEPKIEEMPDAMRQMLATMAPLLPRYMADPHTDKSRSAVAALIWLSNIDQYLSTAEASGPMTAARYEQLQENPLDSLARLFSAVGLALPERSRLEAVLGRDSQAGTRISQQMQAAVELSESDLKTLQAVIDWHPVVDRIDPRLPGTIEF